MSKDINENNNQEKKEGQGFSNKIMYILIVVAVCASIGIVLSAVGKDITPPYNFYNDWQDAKFVDTGNKAYNGNDDDRQKEKSKHSVVIDNHSKRINLLNENFEIVTQNSIHGADKNIDNITSATLFEDSIFVSVVNLNESGSSINNEIIYKTDLYGEVKEILYEKNNSTINKTPSISNIRPYNNYLIFTYTENNTVYGCKINFDDKKVEQIASINIGQEIYKAYYNEITSSCLIVDIHGRVFLTDSYGNIIKKTNVTEKINCSNLYLTDNNEILIQDNLSGKVLSVNDSSQLYTVTKYYDATNNMAYVDNKNTEDFNENFVLYVDNSGYPIYIGNHTNYSFLYTLTIISRWISLLIILIAIFVALIKLIKSQNKLLKKGLMTQTSAAICIFITVLIVAIYYQVNIFFSTFETTYQELEKQCNVSTSSVQNITQEDIYKLHDLQTSLKTSDNKENIIIEILDLYNKINLSLTLVPNNLVDSQNNDISFFYLAFIYDDRSDSYSLMNTNEKSFQNYYINSSKFKNYLKTAEDSNSTREIAEDENGSYICVAKNIKDKNDNVIGCYCYGSYINIIITNYITDTLKILITLIIVCLVLYVLVLETINIVKELNKYKKKKKKKKYKAYLYMIRPMNLFLTFSMYADTVLAILVSKDLLTKANFYEKINGMGITDAVASIPVTVSAGSIVVGIGLFIFLVKLIQPKKIFFAATIMLTLGYIATVYSVTSDSFIYFTISQALTGFFSGCLRTLLYTIASSEKKEAKRNSLLQSISRSTMPGTVTAVLICGTLSTYFGYEAIYKFAAICTIGFLIIGLFSIPKDLILSTSISKQKFIYNKNYTKTYIQSEIIIKSREIIKWLLSPQIIILVVFVIIPFASCKGYKSYFFPLYSTAAGLTSEQISLIYALALMATYLLIHPISNMMSNLQNRQKIINGLLALGFVFSMFSINSRIEWAITVMFLSMIIAETFGTPFRLSWMRIADYNNMDIAQVEPYFYFIEEACNAMQVFFFALFSLIDTSYACFAFGIYCAISALIYGIVSYNSPMRDEWYEAHKKYQSKCSKSKTSVATK